MIETKPQGRATDRKRLAMLIGIAGLWISSTSCSTFRMAKAGREAERHDQVFEAYEYYRSAAEGVPTKQLAAAMHRTSRPAARYWERQARFAIQRGDRQGAWLCLMRELSIRPDWRGPATAIAQLETTYAEEIAPAKHAWEREGLAAVYRMTSGPADHPTAGQAIKPKPPDPRPSEAAQRDTVGPRDLPKRETPAETEPPD